MMKTNTLCYYSQRLASRQLMMRSTGSVVLLLAISMQAIGAWAQGTTPPLGAAATFGLLSGGSIQAVNGLNVIGRVGANQSVSTVITATGEVLNNGPALVSQALIDAQAARIGCDKRKSQTLLAGLAGQSLGAGTYALSSGAVLGQGQSLTLTGDSSSVYVFNIGGALTLKQGSVLNLGHVKPAHVFWHVKGSLSAEASVSWEGVVLTDGPVTFGGNIYGRLTLLAGGSVQFNPRDIALGTLALVIPNPDTGTTNTTCGLASLSCNLGGTGDLIRNGSFESGGCPAGGVDFNGYPNEAASRVGCWLGYSSPDWFTNAFTCRYGGGTPINDFNDVDATVTPPSVPVPTPPHTGGAYAGIYALANGVLLADGVTRVESREYIMQQLPQALQAEQAYYVEYFARLAPSSMSTLGHLQVAFGPTRPAKNTNSAPSIVLGAAAATVVATTGNLPAGSNPVPTWARVGGSFTPPRGSNYAVMMIGNFISGDLTSNGPANSIPTYPAKISLSGAYYYIDDVSLVPFPSAGPATMQLPCGTTTVRLGTCSLPIAAGATYQWSPTTGLSNPQSPNPIATITSGSSITYTLVVSAGGQVFTTNTTIHSPLPQVCACTQQPYRLGSQNSYQAPSGNQPWELGQVNYRPTANPPRPFPINANGSTIVFDGVYHVLSAVEFLNGTFEVRPGTIFYTEGGRVAQGNVSASSIYSGCYLTGTNGVLDSYLQLWVGDKSTLRATGATFTSTCTGQWGGIELRENASLEMMADPATGQRCLVSQARVGVQLGTPCASLNANCSLTSTDFVNDLYGVASLGFPDIRDPRYNTVSDCSFTSDLATILPPYIGSGPAYTRAGLVLHGLWHDGIAYTNNHFESVYVGVEVAGGYQNMAITNNTFTNNYGAAIQVAGGSFGTVQNNNLPAPRPVGDVLLADNKIEIPDNPTPGGQIPTGATVRGIEVLPLPLGGHSLSIESNSITNPNSGFGNTAKPMIGLDMQMSFDDHAVQRQNQFRGLDQGIRLMDAASATTRDEFVTDNYFQKNDQAVVLTGQQYAAFAPAISCNTMQDGNYGLYVESNATVGYLAGPLNAATQNYEPVSNQYTGLGFDVWNASNNSINYYGWDSPGSGSPEIPNSGGLSGVTPILIPGTPCNIRPAYGPGQNGLNRPGNGATTVTASDVTAWEDIISQPNGQPSTLRTVTLQLISYREHANQLAQLESFVNQLAYANPSAYDCISLYLIERYRHLGQANDAQRVRGQLLSARGQLDEIRWRVSYYDVAGHLPNLRPGQAPATADSAALATVAASPSGFAPVACATLRYFYPSLICQASSGKSNAVAARASNAAEVKNSLQPIQLRTWPNPAHTQIRIQMVGLSSQPVRFELINLTTGKTVLTQSIEGKSDAEVSTLSIPAGVYGGRLCDEEHLLGTCKLVIIH